MSKKILSFALVSALMAMCLFPACVMADSWFCPECGTANELNFCTKCGTPRPQATAAPETGNGGGSFLGSWFPSFFQTATPEPAPAPTAAPTDEPAAAVTPASRQSFPGWVIPALDPTPSVTAAPATPLAPSQVPTEVPTPTPTDAPVPEPAPTETPDQSEWLKDFSLIVGLGEVTVDYSGYKATHPGQYYVYTAYGVNDYYTWFTMEPEETNLRLEAVPGEKMVFGVYCDAAENGRPRFDAKQMKSVTLPAAIPYTEISFSEHSHDVILDEGGETLKIRAYALSDLQDEALKPMARFAWDYQIAEDYKLTVLAALRTPSGMLYTERDSFTLHAPDGSTWYYRYTMGQLLQKCADNNDLKAGDYQFELYHEGRTVGAVPFSVESARTLAATPTPRATATPTPKPTKTPTPKPTKTPTPRPRTFRIKEPSVSRGITTVSWEDSENKGPYSVTVQHQYTSGGSTKLAARQSMTTGTFLTSVSNGFSMVPGEPYTITVTDRNGATATYDYRPTKQNFTDFKVKPSMELRVTTGKGTRNGDKSFKASEIEKNLSTYRFYAYLKINYPQIRYERTANWTMAVFVPNGDAFVQYLNPDDNIPAGRTYIYWKDYPFNNLFEYLMESVGSIPTGQYTWALYFDGKQAGTTTFNVTK